METTYTTPGGNYFDLYDRLLNAGHTLIAGAQGSGKSTVIQGIIHTALLSAPYENQLIIIDPKRVDMIEYQHMPHVLKYSTEPEDIAQALDFALSIMETRYNDMQARRLKDYDGSNLYVIIDEVADLMVNPINKKSRTFLEGFWQAIHEHGDAARANNAALAIDAGHAAMVAAGMIGG